MNNKNIKKGILCVNYSKKSDKDEINQLKEQIKEMYFLPFLFLKISAIIFPVFFYFAVSPRFFSLNLFPIFLPLIFFGRKINLKTGSIDRG